MNKTKSAPLKSEDEILLSKLFDGECSSGEERVAHDLLISNSEARDFFSDLGDVKRELCDSHATVRENLSSSTEFWKKVSNRIEQEEKTALLLGPRESIFEASRMGGFFNWLRQSFVFGGLAGACAASVLLLLLSPGKSNSTGDKAATSSFLASNGPADESSQVSPVSIMNDKNETQLAVNRRPNILVDQTRSAMEVDWMRGNGPVKVIQSGGERGPIIWVRRKAPININAEAP